MKKAVVGVAILLIFAAYSLGMRHQNPVLGKPASLAKSNAPASQATTSGGAAPPAASSNYKDGTYTGPVADAYYGSVQVQATISGGRLTGVKFLQYPNTHSTSVIINQQAMPYLKQEALQAQSAHVQIISGATFTSQAFQQSLQAALSQA